MTKLKLLPAALIAAAMLTTPVLARENHLDARHFAERSDDSTTLGARYIDGHLCYPAPRVGAFATQPWDNGPHLRARTGLTIDSETVDFQTGASRIDSCSLSSETSEVSSPHRHAFQAFGV